MEFGTPPSPPKTTALEVRNMEMIPGQGIRITSLQDLLQFAALLKKTDFVPAKLSTESVAVAIQYGFELGIPPLMAVNTVAVINGKPSVYGDGLIGLCRASGLLEDIQERIEEDPRLGLTAYCVVKRRGNPTPTERKFSIQHAKRAGLWDKPGPWKAYPDRMLLMRARGFALRDAFADVLKGLISAEEAQDYPGVKERQAEVVTVEQVFQPPEKADSVRSETPQRNFPEAEAEFTDRQPGEEEWDDPSPPPPTAKPPPKRRRGRPTKAEQEARKAQAAPSTSSSAPAKPATPPPEPPPRQGPEDAAEQERQFDAVVTECHKFAEEIRAMQQEPFPDGNPSLQQGDLEGAKAILHQLSQRYESLTNKK